MSVNVKTEEGYNTVAGNVDPSLLARKVSQSNICHSLQECLDSESAADVASAEAVKELKEEIAQLEDAETFLTGAPYSAIFRRVGKVVQFQMISQVIASYTSNTVLFTVPSSFIPNKTSDTFICYVFDTSNTYRGVGKINSSGGFSFNNGITNVALRVVGSYIIQ